MTSNTEIRVGLVGAGYVSRYHARALKTLPNVRIVGIVDQAADRAAAVAKEFGIERTFGTLAEMAAVRPDVVHVLTPPASHCALTLEALAMGCHVFVEKPMAPTEYECEQMITAARRAGRRLSVNHSAKADPVVVRGLELLAQGACGDVVGVDFFRSSDYPPYAGGPVPAAFRDGGYPFEDIGVHALYLMEAFLGTIRNVDVRYRSTGRDPAVHFDEWRGSVECEKGIGQFFLSWTTRPMRNELIVHGTKGYMHIDCFLQTCTVHKALPGPKAISGSIDAITHAVGALYTTPLNMVRFVTGKLRPSPGIHAGVVDFHRALAAGTEPPVSMEEGRRIVGWIQGACHSADADRSREFKVGMPLRRDVRTLVTGASGLLGRALLDRLRAQGDTVRVLVRRPSPRLESDPSIEVVYGDLGDPAAVDRAVAGVDLVYHVGATMRGRGWPDFQAGTVCGTRNVVDSCLRHRVGRLVYVSSMTVLDYATHRADTTVAEDAPLEPRPDQRGAYTQSKLQAERIVLDAVRDRALPAVVVRPGQIFGPGAESIPPYGTIAIAGRWIVIGSGTTRLPLVYIDDVVDGLLAAATRPVPPGSLFHLVDAAPVTQNEYIELCRNAAPAAMRTVRVPSSVVYVLGAALEVVGSLLRRGVPLSRYRVASIKPLTFDCTKAKELLGWKPVVGSHAGLTITFDRGADAAAARCEPAA